MGNSFRDLIAIFKDDTPKPEPEFTAHEAKLYLTVLKLLSHACGALTILLISKESFSLSPLWVATYFISSLAVGFCYQLVALLIIKILSYDVLEKSLHWFCRLLPPAFAIVWAYFNL